MIYGYIYIYINIRAIWGMSNHGTNMMLTDKNTKTDKEVNENNKASALYLLDHGDKPRLRAPAPRQTMWSFDDGFPNINHSHHTSCMQKRQGA